MCVSLCLFDLSWSGWVVVVVGGMILLLFTNNPRATDCLLEILPRFSHSPESERLLFIIICPAISQTLHSLSSEFCQIPPWENMKSPALTPLE